MAEIKRIEGFESGDYPCIRCGKNVRLYSNGGELDSRVCCGITYRTECVQVDLVIED